MHSDADEGLRQLIANLRLGLEQERTSKQEREALEGKLRVATEERDTLKETLRKKSPRNEERN